jgi:hypothetical protein
MNLSDQPLTKSQWRVFCDQLTRQIEGAQAEIEVASLGIGDQIQAEWAPLLGVAYDPKDDILEVTVEGLDHLIQHPITLTAQREGAMVKSVAVATRAGERHIVKFRRPLMLPGPEGSAA